MSFLNDIFQLFYPRTCLGCSNFLQTKEVILCLKCRFDIPLTNFTSQKENSLERSFYGRIPLEFATSLFYYDREGLTQKLIHKLKYKGKEELGVFFGKWQSDELLDSKRCPQFDYIVPVPLHKKKLKSRGYNQIEKFGRELATNLNIPYVDSVLFRTLDSETQTSKLRIERFENLKDKFFINENSLFENKHILLVDDVVTTGATIEACVVKLLEIKGIKISVSSIAFTE